MKKLTIKETIDNMVDELGRAKEILSTIHRDQQTDELLADIDRTLLNELELFKERIDLALLMAAQVGDVSLVVCQEVYAAESEYEFPIENGVIRTDEVYNEVDLVARKIIDKLNTPVINIVDE